MEDNIAILIADLSGYTALTETHGSMGAADLIDKYIEIVNKSLAGDNKLHERTGDEVMIVSRSADLLLATAVMLMRNTSNEENFLQVHGGLHYGKVLKRNNSYFGSSINLTSRIAAMAEPGTFWCSEEFVAALTNKTSSNFQTKGKHRFKNISEEKEVHQLMCENTNDFGIDPVCRMIILDKSMSIRHEQLEEIYFCSPECKEIYTKVQEGKI
ncbi:MAG: adenylate/guanylate cyclase domain-containing protein [Ferruginibacter sp.]